METFYEPINIEPKIKNIERPTSNVQHRTLNIEQREQRTPNIERRTMRTSNGEQRGEGLNKKYDLEERLLEYSVSIIKLVEKLPHTRAGNHVAGQLLKSGTSAYPNHAEAQGAESARDFVHKMRICLKELRESQRWLKLIERVPLLRDSALLQQILGETEELIKIFVASIKTAQKKKE